MSPASPPAGTPSFVPAVTASDADRFLEASQRLEARLRQQPPPLLPRGDDPQRATVHPHAVAAAVHELATRGKDEYLSRFLDRTRHLLAASGGGSSSTTTGGGGAPSRGSSPVASQQEVEACCVFLLSSLNPKALTEAAGAGRSLDVMRSKLELMHQVLQRDWVKVIAVVVASISACCSSTNGSESPASVSAKGGSGSGDRIVIVEGKPSEEGQDHDHHHQDHGGDHQDPRYSRPNKRARLQPHGDRDDQGVQTCQSPSFDSSLATLRDEDEHSRGHPSSSMHPQDVSEIAKYVVARAAESSRAPSPDLLTADAWMDWHRSGDGAKVAPWLELLGVEGWKKHASSSGLSPGSLSSEQLHHPQKQQALPAAPNMVTPSPTLISFDFSTNDARSSSLLIDISEENLLALREFVSTTELWHRPASDMCRVLMGASRRRSHDGAILIYRADFVRAVVEQFVPGGRSRTSELVHRVLNDFFSLYELPTAGASSAAAAAEFSGCADLKELAVGACFFCAGTKSTKLSTAFELLDERQQGFLTDPQLFGYLRSYLLALVALSLLGKSGSQKPMTLERLSGIWTAVESGARWTLSHFASSVTAANAMGRFTFEGFAGWYSSGGYTIAPWLELLDLSKTLALIQHESSTAHPSTMTPLPLPAFPAEPSTAATAPMTMSASSRNRTDRISSLRRRHSSRNHGIQTEILFSFPLASNRFLVVLKEDASYVREVVETLGLLGSTPDDLWEALSSCVGKRQRPPAKDEPTVYVNEATFLDCMNDASVVGHHASRNRAGNGASGGLTSRDELLRNFFLCFDVGQCDRVALDELMGGLALLCGGKKSMKLSFAFMIFDTRPELRRKKRDPSVANSLSGEDLFLFLRSVLIVMFSCCRQSIDMTDAEVSQCISDTANMICNDVMRHQWETKQANRCNFDEFGQWYNEGGFERAPWLELLDLMKWVLMDGIPSAPMLPSHPPKPPSHPPKLPSHPPTPKAPDIPPPPPEDELDASFFEDNAIMPMDSMDEMDMMLMRAPSTDREIDGAGFRINKTFSFSPRTRSHSQDPFGQAPPTPTPTHQGSPLKFHLITREQHGGYRVSCSRSRINTFREVLDFCGLQNSNVEDLCKAFLSKASRQTKGEGELKITREGFFAALKLLCAWRPKSQAENQRILTGLFESIFAAFDRDGNGRPSVIDVACGLTVLCHGKKSDKLEFAFEVLDKNKRGLLSKQDMSKYLQSFLTVLMSIALTPALSHNSSFDSMTTMDGTQCEISVPTLQCAVAAGADWAAEQAFREFDGGRKKNASMSFDDFAEWYTNRGFGSIPWLELIDLRKWSSNS